MRHVRSESAREQTTALYMKAMNNNNNIHTHRIIPAELTSEPQSCLMGVKGCTETIAVWTLGMPGDCFHREVGFRFGKGAGRRLAIQVNACLFPFHFLAYLRAIPFLAYLKLSLSLPVSSYPFQCLCQVIPFLAYLRVTLFLACLRVTLFLAYARVILILACIKLSISLPISELPFSLSI